MSGRHEAPPVGSAAREATAPPYIGGHEALFDEELRDTPGGPWPGGSHGTRGTFLDWMLTEDIDRCPSCGHLYADECDCLCCNDDHKEAITDV